MGMREALIIGAILVLFVSACGREETETIEVVEVGPATEVKEAGEELPADHPMVSKSVEELTTGKHPSTGGTKEVRISEEVKATWKEVKLEVMDVSSQTSQILTMEVGGTMALKDTGFKLKVEALVPDYAMFADHIGSRSNEPKNVAIMVELFEGDKSVAKGWIFKAFPDFNSYGHERFQLTLVEPTPSG